MTTLPKVTELVNPGLGLEPSLAPVGGDTQKKSNLVYFQKKYDSNDIHEDYIVYMIPTNKPTPGYLPQGYKNTNMQVYKYKDIHSSVVCSSKKLEPVNG